MKFGRRAQPGTAGEEARHVRSPSSPRQRRILFTVAIAASVLAAGAVYVAVVWLRTDRAPMALAGSSDSGSTYLLIGSDERTNVPTGEVDRYGTTDEVPGRRADIILLVRIADDGAVRSLGVPRDLTIFRAGRGPERIAPLLDEGPGAVADGLCNSLGIGVDHVVVVDFAGLASFVDLAAGVEITTDVALRDSNSGLSLDAGTSRLDGSEALAYVRARNIQSNVGGAWIADPKRSSQRSERAIEVLEGLSGALELSWTDPIGSHKAMWTASDAVQVDSSAGPADLFRLVRAIDYLDRSDMVTLPVLQRSGPIPVADLAVGAGDAIVRFNGDGGGGPRCSTPALLGGG